MKLALSSAAVANTSHFSVGITGATVSSELLSYEVARRTHEIGIRMALGAPGVTGVALGTVASFVVTRFLGIMLYDVKPSDPLLHIPAGLWSRCPWKMRVSGVLVIGLLHPWLSVPMVEKRRH
jgi:hypothetical protein